MLLFFVINVLLVGKVLICAPDNDDVAINECIRIERYTENITTQYSYTFQEEYQGLCVSIPPVCKKYRTKTAWKNKTETVPKTRTVKECCVGYEKRNGTCIPVCHNECIHGSCVSPDRCLCDEGFEGFDCTKECEYNRYGIDCLEYCSCKNGATCDRMNGTCHCAAGFTGIFCENNCPEGSYGKNCENKCHCKNGGICEIQKGMCLCPSGYTGILCENKCQSGFYGEKCQLNCTCNKQSTEYCSHLNGYCSCFPGYTGENCEKKCSLGTWGPRCANACGCQPNTTCNHVSGDCDCQPGRRGSKCHETCPVNRWGINCNENCRCVNNSSCDPLSGKCSCLPGWLGSDCSIPCPDGMYGFYCNLQCKCRNNGTCDSVSGNCTCESGWTGPLCDTAYLASSSGSYSRTVTVVFVLSVMCGFFACGIVIIFLKRKANLSLKEVNYEENSSTITVVENDTSTEFLNRHFMNPVYNETTDVKRSSLPKSTATISAVSWFSNSDIKFKRDRSSSKKDKSPTQKGKYFSNQGSECSSAGENRSSSLAVSFTDQKKEENSATTEEKITSDSLYGVSIYDDTENQEEHHYATASEISSDVKESHKI